MVDFNKLRTQKHRDKVIDPVEIFRRLPKPPGVNDLYTSQAEVLNAWFIRRTEKDTVLKLHTGGGKTLVGLLAGQSTLNETGESVLYLTPTVQLVNQTLEKAYEMGIPAVPYQKGMPLNEDFVNGNAIMVATYNALFNGRSKFGLRGSGTPVNASAVILDDAHAAFSVLREAFTLDVSSSHELYKVLTGLFRNSFKEVDRLGTFDDVVSGSDPSVLEVPYWAWHQYIDTVRASIKTSDQDYAFEWPLLRDHLHLCHALISRDAFTITPIQPLVNLLPTFHDALRRIYMSATIADDSDIIKTFAADPNAVSSALTSRSLAGVSERMILVPDLMPFNFDIRDAIAKLLKWTTDQHKGAVVLVSSDSNANKWSDIATVAQGSQEAERYISALQDGTLYGPIVFANRYDGMDLPANSCRFLVMSGLPSGTSNYELFRASTLFNGNSITKMMAQRIEQGIGRGSRGSGDYCVVILTGADLSGWISKRANYNFLTSATRAQLDIGTEISKEIEDLKGLAGIINQSYNRDQSWIEYHAESLADLVGENHSCNNLLDIAKSERKAIDLWQDGYPAKAIDIINQLLRSGISIDDQTIGWMEQLQARIADSWGQSDLAQDRQRSAFAHNKNLTRPKVLPPYRPLPTPRAQSLSIAEKVGQYRNRKGFMQTFDEQVSFLQPNASANQFERALCDLGLAIGLDAERYDINGEGPDVLWLLPNKTGFIIEAKSRKKDGNPLTKDEHGQLLVASEWFAEHYSEYSGIRISVHSQNRATRAAVAGASHALTYCKLEELIAEARRVLTILCESSLSPNELVGECDRLLHDSTIQCEQLASQFLIPFETVD